MDPFRVAAIETDSGQTRRRLKTRMDSSRSSHVAVGHRESHRGLLKRLSGSGGGADLLEVAEHLRWDRWVGGGRRIAEVNLRDRRHATAQHSTAQHSTAQHSTAQHSTVRQSDSVS